MFAHHQAPLGVVLRELRAAEQRAKGEGERNAWSLALIKRSGSTVHLTAKWGEPLAALEKLREFLAAPDVSRRAVYNTLEWLKDLPPHDPDLFAALLGYQFDRQVAGGSAGGPATELARGLVKLAFDSNQRPKEVTPVDWLQSVLISAEFLAREIRSGPASAAEQSAGVAA